MKLFRSFVSAALLCALLLPGVALAQVPGPTTAGTGDVTPVLGSLPFFANGYKTDQYGTWYKAITDSTATTPAVAGKLVTYAPATPGWLQSATANALLPFGTYGVVTTAATVQGGAAVLAVRGLVNALCTTGNKAIAAGSLLVADGSGNLTTPVTLAAPSSGAIGTFGTAGATTYTYTAYARNLVGLDSAASANNSISTGNATLSGTNGIAMSWTIPAGTYAVTIVRTAGGAAQGVIQVIPTNGTQTSVNFNDTGFVAGGAYTAPTVPLPQLPGVVLATAVGTLTTSQSATLTSVFLGTL